MLDTIAAHSILARRLLKQAKIRNSASTAMRVGDGGTIQSLERVKVTACLGDEEVTQHCKLLDTDAFDIVIGTDFVCCDPEWSCCPYKEPMPYNATSAVASCLYL